MNETTTISNANATAKNPADDIASFNYLKNLLVEHFELDANSIQPNTRLYEDLDLDSIDAVDLVIKLQEETGKRIQPEEFKNVRTVNDVQQAVEKLLSK